MSDINITSDKTKLIEKAVSQFLELNTKNQSFILGYMIGVQEKKQETEIIKSNNNDGCKYQQMSMF